MQTMIGRSSFSAAALAALACVLAGACAAPAAAAVNRLTGTVQAVGVPGRGTVHIHVKLNRRGAPVRVTKVVYQGLDARCNVGEPGSPAYEPAGELSGNAGRNIGPAVEFDRTFRWVSYPARQPRFVNVFGKLNRRGTRITRGRIDVAVNTPGACQTAVGTFTARRR